MRGLDPAQIKGQRQRLLFIERLGNIDHHGVVPLAVAVQRHGVQEAVLSQADHDGNTDILPVKAVAGGALANKVFGVAHQFLI